MHLHLQTNNLRQCTTCIVFAMLCARTFSNTQMFILLFCSYISLFTVHDSSSFHHHALFFSASVRWWFLLSPLHNLLVVVPKALLARAEICGPPDSGQWSDTHTIHGQVSWQKWGKQISALQKSWPIWEMDGSKKKEDKSAGVHGMASIQ